jgi:hypothetical protein
MQKIAIWLIIGVMVLTGGFYMFNSYIYNQKQQSTDDIIPYSATLTGEYTCLPHTNTEGPQTLECAFGLKTEEGLYYALDFNYFPEAVPPENLLTGESYTFTGTVTPAVMLSNDYWQKYPIEGIFSVKPGEDY